MSEQARTGFVIGVVVIVALTIAAAFWVGRTNYQPLFTDLGSQDAATIIGELERMKVPYKLDGDGTKVMVAEDVVYETRLKLMGKGVPLQGGVGFEIFDTSDFGMTEFAQKINYQRALQGELARTIMAFEEVKYARVHLVMPETSIFKQNKVPTKASVTLLLKEGRQLLPEQVAGIQRLVAAAVSGLDTSMVTVLDQRGIALTGNGEENERTAASGRLGTKKEVEAYLTRKVAEVLDRAFGPGQAMVSIDATLNLDQVKTTREDVVPLTTARGEVTGAVSKKKLMSQSGAGLLQAGNGGSPNQSGGYTTTEVEYQLGRRVEQIVATPGSLRRLSVGVLVPLGLDEARLQKLREVISAAVGLDTDRGDAIALYAVDKFVDGSAVSRSIDIDEMKGPSYPVPQEATNAWGNVGTKEALLAVAVLVVILSGVAVLLLPRRRHTASGRGLTPQEREDMLAELRQWMGLEGKTSEGEKRT
jgi:flagellar M-ring protein FliF